MATPHQHQQHSALSLSSIAPVIASSSTGSSSAIRGSRKSSISTISNIKSSSSSNHSRGQAVQDGGPSPTVPRSVEAGSTFPSSSAYVHIASGPRQRRVSFVQNAHSDTQHQNSPKGDQPKEAASSPEQSMPPTKRSTQGALGKNRQDVVMQSHPERAERIPTAKLAFSHGKTTSDHRNRKRTPPVERQEKRSTVNTHRSPANMLDTSNESPGYISATPVKNKWYPSATKRPLSAKSSPSFQIESPDPTRISDYDKISNLIGANWLDQELQRLVVERKKREDLDAFISEEDHLVGRRTDKKPPGKMRRKPVGYDRTKRKTGDTFKSDAYYGGDDAAVLPRTELLSGSASPLSSSRSSRSTTPSRSSFSNHLRQIHTDLHSITHRRNLKSKHRFHDIYNGVDVDGEHASPHELLHITSHMDEDPTALQGTSALETLEADGVLNGLLDIKGRMEKLRSTGTVRHTLAAKRRDEMASDDTDAGFFSPEAYVTSLFEDDKGNVGGKQSDYSSRTTLSGKRREEDAIIVGEESSGKAFKRAGRRTLFEANHEAEEARALLRYSVESGDPRVLQAMRSSLHMNRTRLAREMATRESASETVGEGGTDTHTSTKNTSGSAPSAASAADRKAASSSPPAPPPPSTTPPPTAVKGSETIPTLYEPSPTAFPTVSPQLEAELGRQRRLLENMLHTQQNYLKKLTADTAGNEASGRGPNYDSEEKIRFGPYFATATPEYHDRPEQPSAVPRQRAPPPFTISTGTARGATQSAHPDSRQELTQEPNASHAFPHPVPSQIQHLQQKYAGMLLAEEQKRLYAETQWQRALHDLNEKFSSQQQYVLREITNAARRQQETFQKDLRRAVGEQKQNNHLQQQERLHVVPGERRTTSPQRGVEVVMSDQEHAPAHTTYRTSPSKAHPKGKPMSPSRSPYLHRSPVKRAAPTQKGDDQTPTERDSPTTGKVEDGQDHFRPEPRLKALLSPNHPLRRKQTHNVQRRATQTRRHSARRKSGGTRASFTSPFPSASSPPARNVFSRTGAWTLSDRSQSTRSDAAMDTKEMAVFPSYEVNTQIHDPEVELPFSGSSPDAHAEAVAAGSASRRRSSTLQKKKRKSSAIQYQHRDNNETAFAVANSVVHEIPAASAPGDSKVGTENADEEEEEENAPHGVLSTMHPVRREWKQGHRVQSLSESSVASTSVPTVLSSSALRGSSPATRNFRDLGAARLSESLNYEAEDFPPQEPLPVSTVTEQQHFVDRALEDQRRRQQSAQHVLPPMILVSDFLTPMERAKKQEAEEAYNPTSQPTHDGTKDMQLKEERNTITQEHETEGSSPHLQGKNDTAPTPGELNMSEAAKSSTASSSVLKSESPSSAQWLLPTRKDSQREKHVERVSSNVMAARNVEVSQSRGKHFLRPTFDYNGFGAAVLEHPTSHIYVVSTPVQAPSSSAVWLGIGGMSQLAPMQQLAMESCNAYNNHLHHIPFGKPEQTRTAPRNALMKTPFLVRTDYSFSSSNSAEDQDSIPAAVAQPWLYDRSLRREAAELLRDARQRLHRIQELSLPSPNPFILRRGSAQQGRHGAANAAEDDRQRLTNLIANETIHCVLGDAVEQEMLRAVSCSIEQDIITNLVCETLLEAEREKSKRNGGNDDKRPQMTADEQAKVTEDLLMNEFEGFVRTWSATQSEGVRRSTSAAPARSSADLSTRGVGLTEGPATAAAALPWVHETVAITRAKSDTALDEDAAKSTTLLSTGTVGENADADTSLPAPLVGSHSTSLSNRSEVFTSNSTLRTPEHTTTEGAMEVVLDGAISGKGASTSDVRIVLDVSMLMQAIAGLAMDRQSARGGDGTDLAARQQRCQQEEERVRTMDTDLSHCIVEQVVPRTLPSERSALPLSVPIAIAPTAPPSHSHRSVDSTTSSSDPQTPLHATVTERGSQPQSPIDMDTPTAISIPMSPAPSLPTPTSTPEPHHQFLFQSPVVAVPDSLAQLREEISAVTREQRVQHVIEMERIRRRSISDGEDDVRHILYALKESSQPPPNGNKQREMHVQGDNLQKGPPPQQHERDAQEDELHSVHAVPANTSAPRAAGGTDTLQRVKDPVTRFIFEWLRDYEQREASGGEVLGGAQFEELRAQLRAAEDTALEPERSARERATRHIITGRIHDALEEEMEEELDKDAREAATLLRVLAEIDQESDSASSLSSTHASSYTDGGNHKFVDDLLPPLPLPQLRTQNTAALYERKMHDAEAMHRNRRRLDRNLFGANESAEVEEERESGFISAAARNYPNSTSNQRPPNQMSDSSRTSSDRDLLERIKPKPVKPDMLASSALDQSNANGSPPPAAVESRILTSTSTPLSNRHDAATIASEAIANGMRAGQNRLSSTSSGSTATTRYTDRSENTPDLLSRYP